MEKTRIWLFGKHADEPAISAGIFFGTRADLEEFHENECRAWAKACHCFGELYCREASHEEIEYILKERILPKIYNIFDDFINHRVSREIVEPLIQEKIGLIARILNPHGPELIPQERIRWKSLEKKRIECWKLKLKKNPGFILFNHE